MSPQHDSPIPAVTVLVETARASLVARTTRDGRVYRALALGFDVRADEEVLSTEAVLVVAARCPTPGKWQTLAATVPIGPMAAGATRAFEAELANPKHLPEPPANSRIGIGVAARRFARVSGEPAVLCWDGSGLVPGPPPSLARELPEGPTLRVDFRGIELAADGIPLVGSKAPSLYYLRLRYTLTLLRPLGRTYLRIRGDCTFAGGSHRSDEIAKLLHASKLSSGPYDTHSPLFMGTHVDGLPAKAELAFELHDGPFHEPYPELLARVCVTS